MNKLFIDTGDSSVHKYMQGFLQSIKASWYHDVLNFYPDQGWGKYIDSVLAYKYIKNVQVQVQVQGFAKCTWVLPKYIANVIGYNYQVPSTNV